MDSMANAYMKIRRPDARIMNTGIGKHVHASPRLSVRRSVEKGRSSTHKQDVSVSTPRSLINFTTMTWMRIVNIKFHAHKTCVKMDHPENQQIVVYAQRRKYNSSVRWTFALMDLLETLNTALAHRQPQIRMLTVPG